MGYFLSNFHVTVQHLHSSLLYQYEFLLSFIVIINCKYFSFVTVRHLHSSYQVWYFIFVLIQVWFFLFLPLVICFCCLYFNLSIIFHLAHIKSKNFALSCSLWSISLFKLNSPNKLTKLSWNQVELTPNQTKLLKMVTSKPSWSQPKFLSSSQNDWFPSLLCISVIIYN